MRRVLAFLLFLLLLLDAVAAVPNTIFVGSREGDPESFVKNVSTIHGDYSELEVDLCIPGPDPLIISRFYTSKDTLDIATFGGWRFQPQTLFLICPNTDRSGYQNPQGSFEYLDIYVGTPEGSLLKFSGFQNWENPEVRSEFLVDLEEDEVGICNTAKGVTSSWTNAKNHILIYEPKNKSFELRLSSGSKRMYVQAPSSDKFLLSEEVLPSGNQITYEYDQAHRLKQIKMVNASGEKLISWATFANGPSITVETSDGSSVEYLMEKDASAAVLLTEVKSSFLPTRSYQYQVEGAKALLTRKELPGGRYIGIDYERAYPYRVTTLSEPLREGDVHITSFAYGERVTEVQGPLDQKTLYYYDGENRLIAIEENLDNAPYRVRKKQWGETKDQGNLISLSTEDALENILHFKTFSYDQEGNILEEKEYGNLSGQNPEPIILNRKGISEINHECFSKIYSYKKTADEDIVSQVNKQGNGTIFVYFPGTAILKRKEIRKNEEAKRRVFYDYNEDGALVRTTIDNGDTRDINSPDYVKQKFITVITPKRQLPNIGAPEIIEEKAYDPKSKGEVLLNKTINHFDPNGLIIKQDIYDEEDNYLYCIEKTYENERRISFQKDPLGNQFTYVYDTAGNLIQEETSELTIDYQYDLQNNLIQVAQSGNNCPTQKTTSIFDAMGNKIEEIDSLGNRTEFHFDPLGRLIQKTTTTAKGDENTTWTYSYNSFDCPVRITDPLNNTTVIQYNTRGKPTYIASDGKEESFIYSLEGSLCNHINLQGIEKRFEYDYLGRESKIDYYERESKDNYKTDSYYYDAFHLLSENSSKGDIQYIYNSKGRLIQSTFAQNNSSIWRRSTGISKIENGEVTDFAYDTQGRLIETKKWKDQTHYTLYVQKYDLLGRVIEKSIENEQGKLLHQKQFTYNPSGQLSSEIGFPNNQEVVLAEYSYDSFQRLTQVKKGNSIWNISHEETADALKKATRDPLGCITEESYDSKGLLLSRTKKDPKSFSFLDEQFTYDPVNNLVREKNSSFEVSYTHTPRGLCQSITLIHNTTSSFWKSSEKQEALQHSFTYNAYGELIHSHIPSFEKEVEYTYDRRGNLSRITFQEIPKKQSTRCFITSDKRGNIRKIFQDDSFTLESI